MSENIYQADYVKGLFNRMSASYERMNYLTSFGFSIRWRKQFVETLIGSAAPVKVLDLLTGMGETWSHIQRHYPNATISALDFSDGMLKRAERKNASKFQNKIKLLCEDALNNDLPSEHFDVIICAFGLKTFNHEQLAQLARETKRLLKPGGQFSFIEVSQPSQPMLRVLYGFYLGKVILILGRLLLGNPAEYRMLWRYTSSFGSAASVLHHFVEAGLVAKERSYFYHCASGVAGRKVQ